MRAEYPSSSGGGSCGRHPIATLARCVIGRLLLPINLGIRLESQGGALCWKGSSGAESLGLNLNWILLAHCELGLELGPEQSARWLGCALGRQLPPLARELSLNRESSRLVVLAPSDVGKPTTSEHCVCVRL